MNAAVANGKRPWVGPVLALVSVSLGLSTLLYFTTLGREIADDPAALLSFARNPFALFGDYMAAGFGPRWGSFPPLLPLLFGTLVAPWTWIVPDFWAIRLGVLGWTLVTFALLYRGLSRIENTPLRETREALWLYALLPSVWGAVALNPQEESYVAVFGLLLFGAAASGRWRWIPALLALTALAGKYFLLIVAVPLAFASERPIRNLIVYGSTAAGTLITYVLYHALLHDLMPIVSYYSLDSSAAISIWGLLWHLGVAPPPEVQGPVSVVICGSTVLAFCVVARQVEMPLPFTIASSLTISLLTLSATVPAYTLWAMPFLLICFGRMRGKAVRAALATLLFMWGIAEWGANFSRGMVHNVDQVAGGKGAFVEYVTWLMGPSFPFATLHLSCLVLVLLSGIGVIVVLCRASGGLPSHEGVPA